jgi:alpha-galactosidase
VSVVFDAGPESYLLAWRQADAPADVTLALPQLAGVELTVEQLYPPVDVLPEWAVERTADGLTLTVADPVAAARMYRITSS